ncbi:DUF5317 family protein [Clostridiaceae bacterium M8S5]|nr:DUF5317 family protein [Clostridiaceae bacterium M8S5]
MIVESILVSLIVGKIRKGRFVNILNASIRGLFLFIFAAILKISAVIAYNNDMYGLAKYIKEYFFYVQGLVYILIIIGLILNIKLKSFVIITVGFIMNMLVVAVNKGKMPVSKEAVDYIKSSSNCTNCINDLYQIIALESTKIPYIGKIVPIPYPSEFAKIISVGDIIIAIGVFVFIQSLMLRRGLFSKTTSMIEFNYSAR